MKDHFGCWKNHSLFLISGCQSHHTCGLWMTLVCRMTGQEGNVVWGSGWPFHQERGRETLQSGFDTACAHRLLIWVSQKCTPYPAVTFPLDFPEFYLESNHLEHCKMPYSPERVFKELLKCRSANLARTFVSASSHPKQPC